LSIAELRDDSLKTPVV